MSAANILLMEDDQLIAENIRTTLNDQGYNVISGFPEIINNHQAVLTDLQKTIQESNIGLVLMDINLSAEIDGIDLVKQIHKVSDVPVIYISASSKAFTILRAKETEPYAYLLKPFTPGQLISQIHMTLQLYQSTKNRQADIEEKSGVWQLASTPVGLMTSFTWLRKFGFREAAINNMEDFMDIVHPDDKDAIRVSLKMLQKNLILKRTIEYRLITKTSEIRWILSKIIDARKLPSGDLVYKLLSVDITPQKNVEEELRYDSSHDSLTHLLNRKALMQHLEKLIRESGMLQKNFALIFSDLDKFKNVNDDYGHDVGDLLLVGVAERFQTAIKKKDLLARFGGDEFAFLIRDLKKSADIHYIAQKIVNSLQEPIKVKDISIPVSVTMGIAMPEAVSGNAETLLRNADKAMYEAKKDPKNRYKIFRQFGKAGDRQA